MMGSGGQGLEGEERLPQLRKVTCVHQTSGVRGWLELDTGSSKVVVQPGPWAVTV